MSPHDDPACVAVPVEGGCWLPKNPMPEDDMTAVNFLLRCHRWHRDNAPTRPGVIGEALAEHAPSVHGRCPACEYTPPPWRGCDMWRVAERARSPLGREEIGGADQP